MLQVFEGHRRVNSVVISVYQVSKLPSTLGAVVFFVLAKVTGEKKVSVNGMFMWDVQFECRIHDMIQSFCLLCPRPMMLCIHPSYPLYLFYPPIYPST
ncbi:hypothetical protein EYC80_006098 [Monilinia laxa]|uniref:Uncharacterized protein n=1 Tax=Monilinia laxa TaxID=61186 RepID=A0A5N6KGC2_MONLA|nr:hypothetical protein EYC80_006098 [Monilinia laxa]